MNWIKTIFFAFLLSLSSMSFASEVATKDDIRLVLEQMDKRFEQMEKRFEQSDERMNFMESILTIILAAVFGTFFIMKYFGRKQDADLQRKREKINRILFALKNMARADPKVKESLQMVGL